MESHTHLPTDFILKHFIPVPSENVQGLDEITLTVDGPLFGYEKEQRVIVNTTLKPLNGNLVIWERQGEFEVYRFERSQGKATLWPGNQDISQNEVNSLFVIVRESDCSRPRFDVTAYLVS